MRNDRELRLRAIEPHARDRGAFAALLTLEAIEALSGEGHSPTIREVARVRELTMPGVQHHVAILERARLLQKRVKGRARAFQVLDPTAGKADWIEVARLNLNRGQTRNAANIREALAQAVEDALTRVDMEGSQIELVIRHRP